jgi:hypothetical protein
VGRGPGTHQRQDHCGRISPQVIQRGEQVQAGIVVRHGKFVAQPRRSVDQVIHEGVFEGKKFSHLSAQGLTAVRVASKSVLRVVGALDRPQCLDEYADDEGIGALGPESPEPSDHFAEPALADGLRRDAVPQPAQDRVQHPQRRPAERRQRSPQNISESRTAHRLRGEKLAKRHIANGRRATEQVRQAVGPTEMADAVGQVNPIPALLDRIVAKPSLELPAEDGARVGASQLGQRLDVNGKLQSRPQAGLGVGDAAPL